MVKIIDDMDTYYTEIRDAKCKIADLSHDKINLRSEAWKSAEGVAKQKEDYVRSVTSEIQKEIDKLEADVEYYYNQVKLLTHRLEYGDE